MKLRLCLLIREYFALMRRDNPAMTAVMGWATSHTTHLGSSGFAADRQVLEA